MRKEDTTFVLYAKLYLAETREKERKREREKEKRKKRRSESTKGDDDSENNALHFSFRKKGCLGSENQGFCAAVRTEYITP